MSFVDIVLLVIAAAVAGVYLWCRHNYSYWKRHGIPYIAPLPLIGNTKPVFTLKNSFGLHLSDIYNDPRAANAPAVGIYVLNQPALIMREPELVKSVLIKDFSKFSNRYSTADAHGDVLGSNNLFFVRNPEWREIRTRISPVFTSGKIKQMYPLMLEIGQELDSYLSSKFNNGKTTFEAEIKEICTLFTTDIIATVAFGLRANSLQNPNAEFREHGRKFFSFTLPRAFDFFIAFFMPKLVRLFRVKLFSPEMTHFLRKTINYVISERERSGTMRNDLIDILVALKREAALNEKDHFAKNSDILVSQAAVFLTAGFETSSSTMAFALYELAKQPQLQERLRNEICEAFVEGNGTIPYEKIVSLEYLGMVVDEVLRLYPVLPFLDRAFESDSKYSLKPYFDYELPQGMPVFIPVYGLQTDPKYWPDPFKFDPERFSSENKSKHNPMTYLPFGTGPHNCIGSRIGLLQTKLGLVHLLKNHYVKTCEQTASQIIFDPKALVLQFAGGIFLSVVRDRLCDSKVGSK